MNFRQNFTEKQKENLLLAIREEVDGRVVRKLHTIVLLEEIAAASTIEALTGYRRTVAVKFRNNYLIF